MEEWKCFQCSLKEPCILSLDHQDLEIDPDYCPFEENREVNWVRQEEEKEELMECPYCEEENFTEIFFTEKFEDEVKEITIRENMSGMSAPQFINRIVRSLMRGYGYADSTIEKYISESTWDEEYK